MCQIMVMTDGAPPTWSLRTPKAKPCAEALAARRVGSCLGKIELNVVFQGNRLTCFRAKVDLSSVGEPM